MTKRMVIMLLAVAVVLGGVFGFQVFKAAMIKKFMSTMSAPPQTITASKAGYGQWQPKIEAVGSLRAVKGADLSLEVSGIVDAISFNSGDDVQEGAVLLKLRSNDDVAKLESLQATAELDEITYERDQKQFKIQAVSQATLDTDVANLKNAKAQVAQQQAILDKKTGHHSPATSAFAPSTSANISAPGPSSLRCRRLIRSFSISSCRSSRSIRSGWAKPSP